MRQLAFPLAVVLAACSSVEEFPDGGPDDDSGSGNQDVTVIPTPDAANQADSGPVDLADGSMPVNEPPNSCDGLLDGTVCATAADACHTDSVCKASVCVAGTTRPDGYNFDPADGWARCCGGVPTHTNGNNNDCGACGIKCNASNGESCKVVGSHYYCSGCINSAACWSKCCSSSFTPGPSCAASDCLGNCTNAYCPPGTHCATSPNSSDYCTY